MAKEEKVKNVVQLARIMLDAGINVDVTESVDEVTAKIEEAHPDGFILVNAAVVDADERRVDTRPTLIRASKIFMILPALLDVEMVSDQFIERKEAQKRPPTPIVVPQSVGVKV